MLTMLVRSHYIGLQKNVVTMGRMRCDRLNGEIHLSRRVVDALLRFARIGKTGALVEHRMEFLEGRASAGQQKDDDNVNLGLERRFL